MGTMGQDLRHAVRSLRNAPLFTVAAVVTPSGETEVTEETVVATLADKLARFKQPKRVFFVDALPRNSMGKVQKNVLRDQYAKTFV